MEWIAVAWLTVAALVVLVILLLIFAPVLLDREVADTIWKVIMFIAIPLIIVAVAYLLYIMGAALADGITKAIML